MTECIAVQVPELLVTVERVSGLFWYVAVRAWSLTVGENMSFNGSSVERIPSHLPKGKRESQNFTFRTDGFVLLLCPYSRSTRRPILQAGPE